MAASSATHCKPPQHSHDCAFPVQASFRTEEPESSASLNGASLNGARPSNGRASRLAPDAQVALDHSSDGASRNGASLNGAGSSQQNGASVAAADLNGAGRDSVNMLRGSPKREREVAADKRAQAVGQALEDAAAIDAQVTGNARGPMGLPHNDDCRTLLPSSSIWLAECVHLPAAETCTAGVACWAQLCTGSLQGPQPCLEWHHAQFKLMVL